MKNHDKKSIINAFKLIDKNNDGVISFSEMQTVLKSLYTNSKEKTDRLMKLLDLNKSGSIDYTEFMVGSIKPTEYINEENLEKAFHFFDIDHSGAITIEEIAIFLEGHIESK